MISAQNTKQSFEALKRLYAWQFNVLMTIKYKLRFQKGKHSSSASWPCLAAVQIERAHRMRDILVYSKANALLPGVITRGQITFVTQAVPVQNIRNINTYTISTNSNLDLESTMWTLRISLNPFLILHLKLECFSQFGIIDQPSWLPCARHANTHNRYFRHEFTLHRSV